MGFRVGEIVEDMQVVGETSVLVTNNGRQFMSKRIVCRCIVCDRENNKELSWIL